MITEVAHWRIVEPAGISGGGAFHVAGTLTAEPVPPGTVEIGVRVIGQSGTFICGSPERDNTGTVLRFSGAHTARPDPGDTLTGGTWRVYHGGVLDLGGPPVQKIGRGVNIRLEGGTLTPFDLRRNEGGITFRAPRTAIQTSGEFTNAAGARLELGEDASLHIQGPATNDGRIGLISDATMTVTGPFTQNASGELLLGAFCTLNIQSGGTIAGSISGHGVINGDLQLQEAASPGSSPGRLSINGSATLTPSATFDAELSGSAAGAFDVLNVSGPVTLDGTLAIILLNGYRPATADTFTIVEAGAVNGRFSNAPHGQRLATADGYGSFLVSYSATGVALGAFGPNPAPLPSAVPQLPAPEILFRNTPEALLSFRIGGTPGRPYLIESSPDLRTWTPYHNATLNSAGAHTAEFPFDAAQSPRFFRARPQ
jgi:hypothetical protein